MKVLIKISIAVVFPVLLFSGIVIASGSIPQINTAKSVVMISTDESEPLEFDENGVVTNLGYPNVISDKPIEVTLTPREAERALRSILKVMPRLTNGTNVGFLHHMPINRRTSAHVAAGAFIRLEEEQTSTDSTTEKRVDPMLQMGLTYKLTQGLSVTGEFQRYFKSEDDDLERYAVGLVYNF